METKTHFILTYKNIFRMEFHFPYGLKPSRVGDRKKFYREEFDIEKASNWFDTKKGVLPLALDVGTETTRYKPQFKKYLDKIVYIRRFDGHESLRKKLVNYSPEDLYFSPFEFRDGSIRENSELIFEINPDEIECKTCKFRKRKLGKHIKTFCKDCADKAAEKTKELFELLESHFNDVKIVFNGIGYYIIIQDTEALEFTRKYRKGLASRIMKKFPINQRITIGEKDLIRVPGSLNGLVSRKVMEVSKYDLDDPKYIYREKSVPESLK